jgi:hypothetical protein
MEWRRSFGVGVGRWQWRGGATTEEGGAVRTQSLVDVAMLRGRWRRINPSEARTISTDTNKQQSASLTFAGGGQQDEQQEEVADNTTRGKVGAGGTMQGTTQVVNGF